MPSPRLTREAIIDAESRQAEVIVALTLVGEDDLARRMANCQRSRLWRGDGSRWLFRCRLGGCWSCRRPILRTWWAGLREWAGPDATLVAVPLGGNAIAGMRALRRGLRDVRDRAVYRCPVWREVAFGGLLSGATAMVLVAHPEVRQADLLMILHQRWPQTVVSSLTGGEPLWKMDTATAVRLSIMRRGTEPLRSVVMPQGIPSQRPVGPPFLEPMPMLL